MADLSIHINKGHYVRKIQAVNKAGHLKTIVDNSDEGDRKAGPNDGEILSGCWKRKMTKFSGTGAVITARNNIYVTRICFAERKNMIHNDQEKNKKGNMSDSDDKIAKHDFKSKLSAYILDGGDTFNESVDTNTSAKNTDRNNFIRTISRKRIINKLRSSNSVPEDITRREGKESETQAVPNLQPLSKVFDRMHSLNPAENAYTSITDSMYQSLQITNKPPDMNNNSAAEVSPAVCPILAANILATHAESYRHAGIMQCQDCADYVDSLSQALQYLQPEVFGKNTPCNLPSKVNKERSFSSCQVNYSLPARQDMERGEQQDNNKQGRTICYLAAAVLAILVLIVVIVVLTMMVASNKL